jgi:hypothetical protein
MINTHSTKYTALIVVASLIISFSIELTSPAHAQSAISTNQASILSQAEIEKRIAQLLEIVSLLQQVLVLQEQLEDLATEVTEQENSTEEDAEVEDESEEDEEEESEDNKKTTITTSATLIVNNSADVTDDEGSFIVEFSLTAFSSDLYVNKSAERGTVLGTAGANYLIENTTGSEEVTGAVISSLTSSASVEDGKFFIPEGEQETFRLSVVYDPNVEGFYNLQLHSFNFATSPTNPASQQIVRPEEQFETDQLSI